MTSYYNTYIHVFYSEVKRDKKKTNQITKRKTTLELKKEFPAEKQCAEVKHKPN